MPREPRRILAEAKGLAREVEQVVGSAKAYSQTDWAYVWSKLSDAESKLKKLQSSLEALSKAL